jgi:Flp pilus assembly protein TadG
MFKLFAKTRRDVLRFKRARGGAAAVEFALVGLPFFLLTFALAEVTMIGFAQTSLDFAVSETARRIRTGEIQSNGVSQGELREDMCETMNWLLSANCNGNLELDVKRYTSFVGVQTQSPIRNGQFSNNGFQFNPGNPSDIVMVRAYYRWKVITPFFEAIFANLPNGQRMLASTMLFRNEPFPDPN